MLVLTIWNAIVHWELNPWSQISFLYFFYQFQFLLQLMSMSIPEIPVSALLRNPLSFTPDKKCCQERCCQDNVFLGTSEGWSDWQKKWNLKATLKSIFNEDFINTCEHQTHLGMIMKVRRQVVVIHNMLYLISLQSQLKGAVYFPHLNVWFGLVDISYMR